MNFEIQRKKLIKALESGPLTTLQAREQLGIMHPGGRINELRNRGFNIITHRCINYDVSGQAHKVAKYVLISKEKEV